MHIRRVQLPQPSCFDDGLLFDAYRFHRQPRASACRRICGSL